MNYGMSANMVEGGGLYCPNVIGSNAPSQPHPVSEGDQKVIQQADVTVHDVLLGRGRGPNMHPGNQRYREIIYANRDNYNKASNRTEQTRITREIVNHIKQQGRFLKRLETPKNKKKKKRGEANVDAWVEVSDATARLKVGQCLRYKLRQDAEDKDDVSLGENESNGVPKNSETKFTGGAIIPSQEKSSPTNVINVVETEPTIPVQQQPSRKFRKVEIKEEQEPALSPEELEVLQSIGRSGLVLDDDDDDDSFDGFLESNLWEAQPTSSNALLVEDGDDPVPREFTMGSFYDSMFDANGGSYDSNYAYGADIISDAEVLTALGYPQAPPSPTKRPPVICYCGCRVDPSEAGMHRHKCGQRRGIYAGSNSLAHIKEQKKVLEEPPQEDMFCGSSIEPMNTNNTSSDMLAMGSALTPIDESWASPTPIQSEPPQSAPMGHGGMPFHVPESAPMARPRMYRSFMPSQNAF